MKSLILLYYFFKLQQFKRESECKEISSYSIQTLQMLWQPLIKKTNDHTSGKSLSGISSGEFTRELDKESLLN